MEKLIAASDISFSHSVIKRLVLQTCITFLEENSSQLNDSSFKAADPQIRLPFSDFCHWASVSCLIHISFVICKSFLVNTDLKFFHSVQCWCCTKVSVNYVVGQTEKEVLEENPSITTDADIVKGLGKLFLSPCIDIWGILFYNLLFICQTICLACLSKT